MKLPLEIKTVITGLTQLKGVSPERIKAVQYPSSCAVYSSVIDMIRKRDGEYIPEFRLVKEQDGWIFREVLADYGISGHHATIRGAIKSAFRFANIHIDEPFKYEDCKEFVLLKHHHSNRPTCTHESVNTDNHRCTICGLYLGCQ